MALVVAMAERNGDGKGGRVQINLELYGKRLKLLNNKWKEHKKEMWGCGRHRRGHPARV